ncbi:Na+/H+ antiporter NhaA [Arthrobacter sp. M4]|uniref:Na+/H+ antiporter NhaA n=1 Tax=Arthrobacter sp. M4 TaxID=218160 RepID=UPI001CDBCB33|nr:Na+/H+ antiporter NhaA [Arthrobacter sp. M4]
MAFRQPRKRAPIARRRLFSRATYPEYRRIAAILRAETVGGALLLAAAAAALIWANSPASEWYTTLRDVKLGYSPWHLELSLGQWTSDGLLAIFFFLAGLELKREFRTGELRSPAKALVPVLAAVGGVALPAVVYTLVVLNAEADAAGPGTLRGWAIPTATDIAFALAVLAVISTHLPAALRTFLLTLAVVDDLLAIGIIAFFYSGNVQPLMLLAACAPIGLFAVLVRRRIGRWYLLVPLAVAAWALVHASGVHATVAGVLLGFTVPVQGRGALAERLERRLRPFSAGFAVPVFAFFSAGVAFGGFAGLRASLGDPVALGIMAALVFGKAIGVFGTSYVLAKTTRARLDDSIAWVDLAGLSLLAGVGFTVSLLIAELSFAPSSPHHDHAKAAILAGSLTAALLAAVVLRARNRHYRRVELEEQRDDDRDGIPDIFPPKADAFQEPKP